MAGDFESLPVLDVRLWRSSSAEDKASFVSQLRSACHDVGFFYVTGHGVPDEVVKRSFDVSRAFFDLPVERKLTIESINSPHFRGYTRLGNETTNGKQDHREQIDFGSEMPSPAALAPGDPEYLHLHGPNQWPAESDCPVFRSTLSTLMDHLNQLCVDLMSAVAVSLGLPANYFADTFERDPHIRMKILRYAPSSDGAQGVGAHKDYGFLSILLQDKVGGLQALNSAGKWVDAVPIEGTFVVNTGEMLELATHGYYVATVHQVLTNPTQERFSIPYFFNPRLDAELAPLPLDEATLAMVAPTKQGVVDPTNTIFSTYGQNSFKGLARSHPDVTWRHYPEYAQRVGLPKQGGSYA